MNDLSKPRPTPDKSQCSLQTLAILSLIGGSAAGLLGALFRRLLEGADHLRETFINFAHDLGSGGLPMVVLSCAMATALAAWIVRRFAPDASGSGIPQVEGVLQEELPPAGAWLIPVKFFGGVLAIGAGLALGREGPTVQMGATISHLVGRVWGLSKSDSLALLAAGAGAGLATAFNAPIAGAVFVLEELVRRFDTRITIATFGASTSAIAVARLIVGDQPEFAVPPLPFPDTSAVVAFAVLGIVLGIAGVAYNWAIVGTLAGAESLKQLPVELRAALIGAAVGLLAWYLPDLVGGGEAITQTTLGMTAAVAMLPIAFLIRFGLGAVSYAAGTPGGLFAPMLVLGSQAGLIFGTICRDWFPATGANPTAFAVTGMAAFFTAVVRAPLTGIILVIELTGNYTQLLPMLAACFTAMLIPTMWRNPPIYDSLKPRANK